MNKTKFSEAEFDRVVREVQSCGAIVMRHHRFGRDLVEAGYYGFLADGRDWKYSSARLSKTELLSLKGSVTFTIDGYGDDPRELWEIPEVVSWLKGLWERWDEFQFFSSPSGHAMVFAFIDLVPSLRGRPLAEVQQVLSDRFSILFAGEDRILKERGLSSREMEDWVWSHDADCIVNLREVLCPKTRLTARS